MIEYIRGELADLTPALAVVEAHGVGYALNISLNTYSALQGKTTVKLYVHEAIMTGGRDDSYTLYGFASRQERSLYRLLITVSGVGANTARMILSSLTPAELCNVTAHHRRPERQDHAERYRRRTPRQQPARYAGCRHRHQGRGRQRTDHAGLLPCPIG